MPSPRALCDSACPIAPKPTIPSVEPAMRWIGSPVARLQSPVAEGAVVAEHAARKRERQREHVLGDLVRAVDGHVRHRDPARASPRRLRCCRCRRRSGRSRAAARRPRRRARVTCAKQVRIASASRTSSTSSSSCARRSEHGLGADLGEHGVLDSRVGPGDVGDEDLHSPRARPPGVGRVVPRAPPRSGAAGCTSQAAPTARPSRP